MTDTTTRPEPEPPFNPFAVEHITAYLDARAPWAAAEGIELPDGITYLSKPFDVQLDESDVREALRQLAYFRHEFSDMAAASATWRGKYEETRAKLEAVRAAADEWTAYAAGGDERQLAAATAFNDVLRALNHHHDEAVS